MCEGLTQRFSGKARRMGAEGKPGGVSEWNIRAFVPTDIAGIRELFEESPEAGIWSGQGNENLTPSPSAVWLVCEDAGRILGILMGQQVADEAEIHNLGVRRSERRRGIGGALVNAGLEEFHKKGASRVYLEVRESNAAAIALYRSRGFTENGRRKGYYQKPEEAAVLMGRDLKA
jgi:ribosomal-protein-alanine N-acetyltransferase